MPPTGLQLRFRNRLRKRCQRDHSRAWWHRGCAKTRCRREHLGRLLQCRFWRSSSDETPRFCNPIDVSYTLPLLRLQLGEALGQGIQRPLLGLGSLPAAGTHERSSHSICRDMDHPDQGQRGAGTQHSVHFVDLRVNLWGLAFC